MSEPNLNERINSAATPKTAGAIEASALGEREAIAAHLDERAKDFEGLPVTEMELTRLAREIRDGAHHEEKI